MFNTKRRLVGLLVRSAVLFAAGMGLLRAECLPDGVQSSGALYRICLPETGQWNGDLVLWAHGYVAADKPLAIDDDEFTLPDGTTLSLSEIVNQLGFAFATTSYSVNGLAVPQAVADLLDLVNIFKEEVGNPGRVYLVGASEGGLVTALSIEKHPEVYAGGLAACGPIGDFPRQINSIGDFRVVFDYFFPGLIPGSPIDIPPEVMANWESVHVPQILAALRARPLETLQLLLVTKAAIWFDPASIAQTTTGVLWYDIFGSNDATAKLGGQPFDNISKVYRGSFNDARLNAMVQRFAADPAALAAMAEDFTTTGILIRPLVTLHTIADPIVPYWHEQVYASKVEASGSRSMHVNIPILRYGHCQFQPAEALFGFLVLILKTTGTELSGMERLLPDTRSREEFRQLKEKLRPAVR